MALSQRPVAHGQERPFGLSHVRRWPHSRVDTLHPRNIAPLQRKGHLLHGGRERAALPRSLQSDCGRRSSGGQPHVQPYRVVQTLDPHLCPEHPAGQRPHQGPSLPPAPRLDAPLRVLVVPAPLQDCDVGPGDTRLLQVADGRRCGAQREALHPQWLHHHLPRLAQEHR